MRLVHTLCHCAILMVVYVMAWEWLNIHYDAISTEGRWWIDRYRELGPGGETLLWIFYGASHYLRQTEKG